MFGASICSSIPSNQPWPQLIYCWAYIDQTDTSQILKSGIASNFELKNYIFKKMTDKTLL